jgi:hypothetical protein
MFLGTGRNAASCFAVHSSAETKRMHRASRNSPECPESLCDPHGSAVVSRGRAVIRTAPVGHCHHGMALPRVADGGKASSIEGSCEYTEYASADGRQGVVLQLGGWARC